MITLTYTDAYKVERTQQYDQPNDFIQALAGCLTIPDNYPVTAVTYNGKDLAYKGTVGGLYQAFVNYDWAQA